MTDDKLAYSIADAAEALGIGRSTIYELISSGKMRANKIGRRTVITKKRIRKILEFTPSLCGNVNFSSRLPS
ncbi:MAG: helix-turn-helix domain-containing protein [Sphingopyxis sp.]|nr:helix-turn-helix domain-containing protein [Sphingopyxis sp.]